MPLYEYKCQSCGDLFEVIQKFSDTPIAVHEACGGPVERLISTSALQFKGSGWYVNDYGKGNSKEPKPAPSASNGDSKSSESNTESKADKSNGSSTPAESKSEKSTKTESSSSTASTVSKPDGK